MPTVYKVLGQSKPTLNTATTLYTVPASTSAIVSTINIANLSNDIDSVSVSVRPAGAEQEDKHYLIRSNILNSYESLQLTIGITMATTDVVTVHSLLGKCSFNLFGSEIS